MARKAAKIQPEQYEALLSAYRDDEGNVSNAAKVAGVAWATAKRGWARGWPDVDLPAIKDAIAAEKMQARAEMESAKRVAQKEAAEQALVRQYKDQQKARADAVAARKAEADMVRAYRGDTIALISVAGQAMRGALRRAKKLEEQIATGKDEKGRPLGVLAQVNLLDRLARAIERAGRAMREGMTAERILLGEPTEIIGIQDMGEMTEEAVLEKIARFQEAADRIRARKEKRSARLQLLQGGRANGKSNGHAGSNGQSGPATPANGAG